MPRTSAKKIKIAERRQLALSLRKTGATYDKIAKAIAQEYNNPKYSRTHAFIDIDTELKALNEECTHSAEQVRRQELERLDEYLMRLANKIKLGDTQAINTALKVSERRSKLLGLDSPIEVRVEEGVQGELRAFVEMLEARLPRQVYEQVLGVMAQEAERAAVARHN